MKTNISFLKRIQFDWHVFVWKRWITTDFCVTFQPEVWAEVQEACNPRETDYYWSTVFNTIQLEIWSSSFWLNMATNLSQYPYYKF